MLSNMCKLIFLVLFLQACASNRNIKEYIIDTKYNQAVGGYEKGTLFEVNRKYWYQDYIPDSFIVKIGILPNIDLETSKLYRLDVFAFAGVDKNRYMTSKGVKLGDSIKKAEDIYGKPIARNYSPGYLTGGFLVDFPGLRYKNLMIVADTSTQTILGFMIGDFSHSW